MATWAFDIQAACKCADCQEFVTRFATVFHTMKILCLVRQFNRSCKSTVKKA
ncbi:hypothetical protein [Wielerella bovis]|uniref:hypothetical protein n=1 Tax=Wielerella bovis TaxID=2917790 RepID=UPI002018E4BE|nr:hypothetical protein [Wielerella bovis]ULJ61535.1 hypothetical protein MIS44_02650 [Wielerella bovis]